MSTENSIFEPSEQQYINCLKDKLQAWSKEEFIEYIIKVDSILSHEQNLQMIRFNIDKGKNNEYV